MLMFVTVQSPRIPVQNQAESRDDVMLTTYRNEQVKYRNKKITSNYYSIQLDKSEPPLDNKEYL